MQNYKRYAIPPAQLIIADVPYNVGNNFYGRAKNEMLAVEGEKQMSIEDFPEVMPK